MRISKEYPQYYTDPDVTDAEHLTRAAWHLIQAGYGDASLPFIQAVCRAFENVEINRRLNPPCKALGNVQYLPSGILRYTDGKIDVPAPAYEAGTEEEKAADHKKTVAKRGADSCRRADLGWFPQKQAAAAFAGRMPNTASFRPAATLRKIWGLCEAYGPDMPIAASLVLAEKLREVIAKCPLSHEKWTRLKQDLVDFGGSRYSYDRNDSTMGFAYLSEAQVRIAADIIERDSNDQQYELGRIDPQVIKWPAASYDAMHDIYNLTSSGDEACQAAIPFVRSHYEAYFPERCGRRQSRNYYSTQEYWMNIRIGEAFYAMQDVNDLMRCHAALCRHDDEYLHGLLVQTKMIDEDLDASIPPDLWMQAARLMAVRMHKPFNDPGITLDEELAASAESAVAEILAWCDARERLDSELLHPVPEADAESGPDQPGTEPEDAVKA